MQLLEFCSASNCKYRVALPAAKDGLKSAFLFSFHKSGSTLMDNMVRRYCDKLDIPTFSLFNAAFDSGIPTNEIMADSAVCFAPHGRIYTGFRHYPTFDLDLSGVTSILLVRDPRDMLVSMYYSVTRSHVVPNKSLQFLKNRREASNLTVDEFAVRSALQYKQRFDVYLSKLPIETLTTYRYEDVIYEKNKWLENLITIMDLPKNNKLIRSVVKEFDIFPETEDVDKHIRQVHPGNYRNKLQKKTIDILNDVLGGFLDHYHYTK